MHFPLKNISIELNKLVERELMMTVGGGMKSNPEKDHSAAPPTSYYIRQVAHYSSRLFISLIKRRTDTEVGLLAA